MGKMTSDFRVDGRDVAEIIDRLQEFLEPYLPLFGRLECHGHARMYVEGRIEHLERRTLEPIAAEHGVHRRPLQHFVGAGVWEDGPVLDLLNAQVAHEIGRREGVLVLDSSGFQKWGRKSVGVARQWCGRLGKVENCQVAEFLAYASPKGQTLVDFRLYLPREWAEDGERRAEAYVPPEVEFHTGWELALEMVTERAAGLPHRWVVGDDTYGRVTELRDRLAAAGERYLLDVPANTVVDPDGAGERSVAAVARSIPARDWERVRTRDGEKGPVTVRATKLRVTTRRKEKAAGCRETLLIMERADGERVYGLSNARGVPAAKMAKAAACRHYIEEALETAKGEAGLAEYEVRSWVGWHHHMTLSLLAQYFLVGERRRLKKNAGADGFTTEVGPGFSAGGRARRPRRRAKDRPANDGAAKTQRGITPQPLAPPRSIPALADRHTNTVGLT